MESLCVAVPLKPGMWEVVRQHQDELVNALNTPEEEYAREHRGMQTVKVFHQSVPIEALLLYFEADNLEEAFHPRHRDHETAEKWKAFWSQVAVSGEFMTQIPQLIVDWHHQEGHRQKAAPRTPRP